MCTDYGVETFPKRLKQLRLEIGVSQEEMAKKLDVSRAAIGYYENGERVPDIRFLARLIDLTGCSTGYLLGYADQMKDKNIPLGMEADLSDSEVEIIRSLSCRKAFHYFLGHEDLLELFDTFEQSPPLSTDTNFCKLYKYIAFRCASVFEAISSDILSRISEENGEDVQKFYRDLSALEQRVDKRIAVYKKTKEQDLKNCVDCLKEEKKENKSGMDKFQRFQEKMYE